MDEHRGEPAATMTGSDRGSAPPPRTPGGIVRTTFASLAYRDFVYLWLGQSTHAMALWLEQTARPLLVLALTDNSPIHLGGVILVRTLPAVGLGMVAGVVADNFNRRTVLLATKVAVLGLSIVFAVVVATGIVEVWHVYVFSFLRGATMAFDQPARRALIPTILPQHLVINGMALTTGSMTSMRIAGAAGAGLLMGYWGIAAPFIAIVFAYIGAVYFTLKLRTPDHARTGYQGVRSMGGDLMAGLRYAWSVASVRGVLVISLGYFMFGMAYMQVFAPLFAKEVLEIGETGFGYMISVMGIGGLIGALVLAATNPTRRRGVIMLSLVAGFGVLLVFFSLASYTDSLVLVFLLAGFLGLGQSVFMPLINSVLIEAAPENMRGRLMGVLSLDRAMMAFGGFMAGMLAGAVGTQPAQIAFGVGCILTAVVMYAVYPALRRIE